MKKTIFTTFILLALILSACGTTQTTTPGAQNTPGNGELPQITKLVIGTLNLKDTENAVTAEQAQELLPLWQVYLSLLDSDTAAQEEIDALVDQISETMTPEQTQAITDMQLSQEDMFSVMQENGMGMGNLPQTESGNQSGNFSPPGGGEGFAPPEGGGPNGGIPGGNGEGLDPEQIATAQAAREAGGGGFGMNSVPTALIEAVIEYLQETAGS